MHTIWQLQKLVLASRMAGWFSWDTKNTVSVLIYQETGLQTSCEFQRVELSFGMFMYQLTYVQSYEQHLSRFGLNFNQTDFYKIFYPFSLQARPSKFYPIRLELEARFQDDIRNNTLSKKVCTLIVYLIFFTIQLICWSEDYWQFDWLMSMEGYEVYLLSWLID